MPSFGQSLDELDDDDAGDKDRREEEEEELVQANTVQNEAMMADPTSGRLMVRRLTQIFFYRWWSIDYCSFTQCCTDGCFDSAKLRHCCSGSQQQSSGCSDAKPKGVPAFHHPHLPSCEMAYNSLKANASVVVSFDHFCVFLSVLLNMILIYCRKVHLSVLYRLFEKHPAEE